jgi:hypothetical protein
MCDTDTVCHLVGIPEHPPSSHQPRQILEGCIHRLPAPTGRSYGLLQSAELLSQTWVWALAVEMLALGWSELVLGVVVVSAEAFAPALVTFGSMVLVEIRNLVGTRQTFEESWEVCPVCDVFVLLHGKSDQYCRRPLYATREGIFPQW